MYSSATTAGTFLTATGLTSLKGLWERLLERTAVTTGQRKQSFPLSEEVIVEIQYEGPQPYWLVPSLQSFSDILSLPEGWDSYGARPVSAESIMGAIYFLLRTMDNAAPPPEIAPHPKGTVQLEWHTVKGDLEVEVLSADEYKLSYSKGLEDVQFEDLVTRNLTMAITALREISGRY